MSWERRDEGARSKWSRAKAEHARARQSFAVGKETYTQAMDAESDLEAEGSLPDIDAGGAGMVAHDDPPTQGQQGQPQPDRPINGTVPEVNLTDGEPSGCDDDGVMRIQPSLTMQSDTVQGPSTGTPMALDAITGSFTNSTTIERGGGTKGAAFGAAGPPSIKLSNITFNANGGAVQLGGTITSKIPWDVSSDLINITGAEDPAITRTSAYGVINDLKPDGGGKFYGWPKRSMWWVKSFTEAHEKFHAEEIKKFIGEATPHGTAWLQSQTVETKEGYVWKTARDPAAIAADLAKLLVSMLEKIRDKAKELFEPDKEKRAYAAGAADYEALIDLIKARIVREQWDKPDPNATNE
jgi:hypothetical protein